MKKQQRGGTILGIILGIIVGLGAALGVAVYVSKVPVPFLSKSSKNADQDAAEAKKNKDWDPNSPLYGKNPARITVPVAPYQFSISFQLPCCGMFVVRLNVFDWIASGHF